MLLRSSSPFERHQSSTFCSFGRRLACSGGVVLSLSLLLLSADVVPSAAAAAAAIVEPKSSGRTGSLIGGDSDYEYEYEYSASEDAVFYARQLLVSLGVPERNLCRSIEATTPGNREDNSLDEDEDDGRWALPVCGHTHTFVERTNNDNRDSRYLVGDEEATTRYSRRLTMALAEEEPIGEEDPLFYFIMASCALLCVVTAAIAAGLTMGMLSLDPLMLLVKIRASRSPEEKAQAESLLPIVKQHHMLLVTLLLLNSMANEALPLFLDRLVSPFVAVLLSVSFVLIFGEILPSAIFTGPKKLELASRMVPLVKTVMTLVWPIAFPIATLLDKVLHDDEGEDDVFDRGEISALVRIQYEERLANKRQRKLDRMNAKAIAGSARPNLKSTHDPELGKSARHLVRSRSTRHSISFDEVVMVEGALKMKTKTVLEVYTPGRNLFAIPEDLILNEDSVVEIYSSGYSRIPVYEKNLSKPRSKAAIKGILNTKHLIVVNMNEDRPLSTMPLFTPPCVSPTMNMVELVNLFQTGREGHFALVCTRPKIGTDALKKGDAIPDEAGFIGIITLEDALEELLQEEIFDENDQNLKDMERIAIWVARKWRHHKRKRELNAQGKHASFGSVVDALRASTTNESTHLLAKKENAKEIHRKNSGLLGPLLQVVGINQDGFEG